MGRSDVGTGVFEHWETYGQRTERLSGHKALQVRPATAGTPGADPRRIDHQQKLLAALRRQAPQWDTVRELPGIINVAKTGNINTGRGSAIPLGRALSCSTAKTMTTARLREPPLLPARRRAGGQIA